MTGGVHGEDSQGVPSLALRSVSKSYGGPVALDSLDLEVYPGECVALLGHNGSGKTTALKLSAGHLEPSEGSVEVEGVEMRGGRDDPAARRAVSLISDEPVFYDDLTVGEHLELVGLAHGLSGGLDERMDEVLGRFGMRGREDFLPGQLSRGLRQKAQMACALIRPFSVLLLDEPVVGLDPASRSALRETLRAFKSDGKAILMSTHQLAFGRGIADRAVILQEGRAIAAGSYEETIEREETLRLGLS